MAFLFPYPSVITASAGQPSPNKPKERIPALEDAIAASITAGKDYVSPDGAFIVTVESRAVAHLPFHGEEESPLRALAMQDTFGIIVRLLKSPGGSTILISDPERYLSLLDNGHKPFSLVVLKDECVTKMGCGLPLKTVLRHELAHKDQDQRFMIRLISEFEKAAGESPAHSEGPDKVTRNLTTIFTEFRPTLKGELRHYLETKQLKQAAELLFALNSGFAYLNEIIEGTKDPAAREKLGSLKRSFMDREGTEIESFNAAMDGVIPRSFKLDPGITYLKIRSYAEKNCDLFKEWVGDLGIGAGKCPSPAN